MVETDPARYAREAAREVGAEFADLDAGAGYLFRVSRGGRSVVLGAGGVVSFPANSATAFTLSRDKAHTKTVLSAAGLPTIPGGLFFAHTRRAGLRGPGREVEDARRFAAQLGYPVFAKPNQGSRGNFAEIVFDDAGMADYAARVAVEFESFLVEPVMRGSEHRVLVQDGRCVFHSVKEAPALPGDGRATAGELLAAVGLKAEDKPSGRIALPGRRNLSAAGSVEEVSTDVPPALADIAVRAVAALGLRIGAVDLFDVSGDLSGLRVIEVNGNPGLKTLEIAGRMDLIRGIWVAMLNEMLEG